MAAPNPNAKVSFFKRLKNWVSKSKPETIEKIKNDSFGHTFFIQPEAVNFTQSIICMANDETKLAREIKLKSVYF